MKNRIHIPFTWRIFLATFLLCLLSTGTVYTQIIQAPEVLQWDSSLYITAPHLVRAEGSTILFGVEKRVGSFFCDVSDSLSLKNKTYVNPQGVGAYEIGYQNGKFYLGGTSAKNAQERVLGMARFSSDFQPEFGQQGEMGAHSVFGLGMTPTADSGGLVVGAGLYLINQWAQVAKFSSGGDLEWERLYKIAQLTRPFSAVELPSGTLCLTGLREGAERNIGNHFLLLLAPNGDSIATYGYGSNYAWGYEIFATDESELILCGIDRDSTSSFPLKQRLSFIKTDTLGNMLKHHLYPFYLPDSIDAHITYGDVTHTSDGGVLFAATITITDTFSTAFPYLLKVDSEGEYQWHKILTPITEEPGRPITVTQMANGNYLLISEGGTGMSAPYTLFTLLGPDGTYTDIDEASPQALHLTASPNPATSQIELSWTQSSSAEVSIKVIDLLEKTWRQEKRMIGVGEASLGLPLDRLPDGVYLIELESEGQHGAVKIVKQEN